MTENQNNTPNEQNEAFQAALAWSEFKRANQAGEIGAEEDDAE